MMKTKGVSFNLENETDKEVYEYAMQFKNFSGHVKQLILDEKRRREMMRQSRTNSNVIKSEDGVIKINL